MDRIVFESIIKHILQEIPGSDLHKSISDPENYQYITTKSYLWLAGIDYSYNMFTYYALSGTGEMISKELDIKRPNSITNMMAAIKNLIENQPNGQTHAPNDT